jgi:transglutaminase-like putative cysteine protease
MSAERWAYRLAWALDFLALIALAGSGEVDPRFFAWILLALLVSRVPVIKITEKILFFFLVLGAFISIFVWIKLHQPPILVAAYFAPIVHAALWFAPKTPRYRAWRLGLGFVELIIASALTVEIYLPVIIFIFVVIAAVKISCEFLDEKLRTIDLDSTSRRLPAHYIRSSLKTSFLIFLTSMIIFPILPRVKTDGYSGSGSASIGYTEDVSLTEDVPFSASQVSNVVLWFYPKDGADLSGWIHRDLIRMKVLSGFNGTHWSSDRRSRRSSPFVPSPTFRKRFITIDAVRDSLGSFILPLPYGAENVRLSSAEASDRFQRQTSGEWIDTFASNDRLLFTFDLYAYGAPPELSRLNDPPEPVHLSVPENLRDERMQKLVHRIFDGAKSEREKVDRLRLFFINEKFQASVMGMVNEAYRSNPIAARMHPLERFLLLSKEGHCEWFASASAILLRLAGVPTRLATGFRVSQKVDQTSLRIMSSDAHAWVEVWLPDSGWVPYDPTPRLILIPSLLSFMRGQYDNLSGYWYRYILTFSNDGSRRLPSLIAKPISMSSEIISRDLHSMRELAALTDYLGVASIGFLIFLVLAGVLVSLLHLRIPQVNFFARPSRGLDGHPDVCRERLRLERYLKSALKLKSVEEESVIPSALLLLSESKWGASKNALIHWITIYERLRFGRPSDLKSDALIRLRRNLKKTIYETSHTSPVRAP